MSKRNFQLNKERTRATEITTTPTTKTKIWIKIDSTNVDGTRHTWQNREEFYFVRKRAIYTNYCSFQRKRKFYRQIMEDDQKSSRQHPNRHLTVNERPAELSWVKLRHIRFGSAFDLNLLRVTAWKICTTFSKRISK